MKPVSMLPRDSLMELDSWSICQASGVERGAAMTTSGLIRNVAIPQHSRSTKVFHGICIDLDHAMHIRG
jgi:hypothetical protein